MEEDILNYSPTVTFLGTLKIYKGKKKIRKPSGLSLNPLFKKECHILSDKLESMIH